MSKVSVEMVENKSPGFEETLNALEQVVSSMEKGELSLDDSIQAFEKGIRLAADAQKALDQAQAKVSILMAENEQVLQPFQVGAEDA